MKLNKKLTAYLKLLPTSISSSISPETIENIEKTEIDENLIEFLKNYYLEIEYSSNNIKKISFYVKNDIPTFYIESQTMQNENNKEFLIESTKEIRLASFGAYPIEISEIQTKDDDYGIGKLGKKLIKYYSKISDPNLFETSSGWLKVIQLSTKWEPIETIDDIQNVEYNTLKIYDYKQSKVYKLKKGLLPLDGDDNTIVPTFEIFPSGTSELKDKLEKMLDTKVIDFFREWIISLLRKPTSSEDDEDYANGNKNYRKTKNQD